MVSWCKGGRVHKWEGKRSHGWEGTRMIGCMFKDAQGLEGARAQRWEGARANPTFLVFLYKIDNRALKFQQKIKLPMVGMKLTTPAIIGLEF